MYNLIFYQIKILLLFDLLYLYARDKCINNISTGTYIYILI